MFNFQKLDVYQNSKQLVIYVYKLLEKFPEKERFALCDQLRRAVVSVPSNIAEGISRNSTKEQIHFIGIGYASMMEVFCQMDIAHELKYITTEDYKELEKQIIVISRELSGLKKYISEKEKRMKDESK